MEREIDYDISVAKPQGLHNNERENKVRREKLSNKPKSCESIGEDTMVKDSASERLYIRKRQTLRAREAAGVDTKAISDCKAHLMTTTSNSGQPNLSLTSPRHFPKVV